MVNLPIVQQPIPFNVQAQLPLESIRVDNQQVPPVPQPSQLFQSTANRKTDNSKNPNNTSNQSVQNKSGAINEQSNEIKAVKGKDGNKPQSQNQDLTNSSSQKDLQQQQQIQTEISQLSSRDREVRAHESAHAAVGGQFAGSPQFTYQKGPNGVLYAVSGEVSISTSEVPNNPKATLAKLETVVRAALAPADPSAQDIRVAANAASSIIRIRAELASKNDSEKVASSKSSNQNSILIPEISLNQVLQSRIQNSGALLDTNKNTHNLLASA